MQLGLPLHREDNRHDDASTTKDFICQTSKHLSTNTPRKNKQRKVIRAQRKKIYCLQETLKKKKSTKKGGNQQTLEEALGKLPENLSHFVRMQLKLHSRKEKGRRYSISIMQVAKHTEFCPNSSFYQQSHQFIATFPRCQQQQESLRGF